jgi:hypothetical protein
MRSIATVAVGRKIRSATVRTLSRVPPLPGKLRTEVPERWKQRAAERARKERDRRARLSYVLNGKLLEDVKRFSRSAWRTTDAKRPVEKTDAS